VTSLPVGSPVTVRKLKPGGALDYSWQGVMARCDPSGIVIRAEFNVDIVQREWATFRRGDIFHEFYYWHKWFNVFHINEPDGTFKGWYANVGQPAELSPESNELRYVDLALDVWVRPNGEYVVLDEPDFDQLIAEHVNLREGAKRGRDDLMELVSARNLPRWPQ
jgi:protein associated with RNAse G/E